MNNPNVIAIAVLSALLGACTGTGSESSAVASSSIPVLSSSSIVNNSSSVSSSMVVASSSNTVVSSSSAADISSSSSAAMSSVSTGGVNTNTDLPAEMRITDDGEKLELGGFYSSKLYDETVIETMYLDFPQGDYLTQLANNYSSKTEIEATLTYKGKVYEQVGVRYRGNTSYQRAGDKKSFAVDLEWAIDGQDINGYNDLKLNNAFEDTSSMREVLYANLARKNIPTAKGNFVNVVVNGKNYGVYANIQKLNKDHVKEWFLDNDATRWRAEAPSGAGGGFGGGGGIFGAGTSTLNNLGENGSSYEKAYTLKSSSVDDPWQDLANAAYAMGTGVVTSAYYIEQLSQYMDIDAALWFVATENIFTDDDSYVNKGGMDYYVYFDVATGRIIPIEYDGNSAMETKLATSWTPFYNATNKSFPLLNVLLNIPELRQRYLAHYRTLMEEAINPEMAQAKITAYDQLINSHVAAEAVRIYSYAQYTSGVTELKNFFTSRTNYLKNNNEVNQVGLSISNVKDAVNGQVSVRPTDAQAVQVSATVTGDKGVKTVNLYYGTNLMGGFSKLTMASAGNGNYSATIPAQSKGAFVRYYIEAIANDTAATASYSPVGAEHDVYIYQVISAETAASPVVINEIMPANKSVAIDEEGDYGDWVELYNTSNQAVDLTGYYLTDEETKLDRWAFPAGTTIKANSTLIVWADDKAELTTALHANFKLSAAGENVYLVTPSKAFADQVTFVSAPDNQSYARSPNGTGAFVWTANPSFNKAN